MGAGGGNSRGCRINFDYFNIDKQEYQPVFIVVDKFDAGEISNGQVFELNN